MTMDEFAGWRAFFALHPWGEEVEDFRTGILASTIANANRGQGTRPYKPQDFIPQYEQQTVRTVASPRKQTPQEMMAVFRTFTRASGGTIISKHSSVNEI